MADSFADLAVKAASAHLTYETYLAEVVQCECTLREQRRIARLLRQSGLPLDKTFRTLELDRFPLNIQQQEVIEICRGRIASFKIPRRVIFVDQFPLTGSGKIQKYLLRGEAERLFAADMSAESRLATADAGGRLVVILQTLASETTCCLSLERCNVSTIEWLLLMEPSVQNASDRGTK
jgi:hypothetical protein